MRSMQKLREAMAEDASKSADLTQLREQSYWFERVKSALGRGFTKQENFRVTWELSADTSGDSEEGGQRRWL